MEKERLMDRKWLVCDMDGFYAACEELANPELKKVPVAVAAWAVVRADDGELRGA
jgi:DNA polymerase kappa